MASEDVFNEFGEEFANRADAILRDPNVPGDVRAFVSTLVATQGYMSRVQFNTDDGGFVTVEPRGEGNDINGNPIAPPAPEPAAPEPAAPVAAPEPAAPAAPAAAPTDTTQAPPA